MCQGTWRPLETGQGQETVSTPPQHLPEGMQSDTLILPQEDPFIGLLTDKTIR